jgi:hypothetical protein
VSRDRPGLADELQSPYTPVPAFAPFSVNPGDWFGVGLHYAVAPACTVANAGTTVTVDRTFSVTYKLEGRTVRSTYTGVPLNVTYPSTCPTGAAAAVHPAAACAPLRRLLASGRSTSSFPVRVHRLAGGSAYTWTQAPSGTRASC